MIKMGKVVDIEANLPHEVSELMCVVCYHRWIGTFPQSTLLKQLECPKCRRIGYVIKTGQTLDLKEEI